MSALRDHEELHVRRGTRTGCQVVIGVHSTSLGPALGGARLWRYGTPGDAIADALRLSEAMTYKAAAAGLDLGGGKCVLCPDGELTESSRRELMLDLGDVVESLEGRYITAEDVGTGTADMEAIAERTSHVVGLPTERGGTGDPSPLTARGVEAAMRACAERALGSADLAGVSVCVIGIGHVGLHLATLLRDAGAELLVSDVDPKKRELAQELGAEWVEPEPAMLAECDILAPCALGGAVNDTNVDELRCRVVCGSANNVLAHDGLAAELAARGILYAPDFIANAGGLINVYAELHKLAGGEVESLVEGIGESLARILEKSERHGATPLAAALDLARERLDGALRPPRPATLPA